MTGWIVFGLIAAAVVGYLVWTSTTDAGRQYATKALAEKNERDKNRLTTKPSSMGHRTKLSNVGDTSSGTLACPKCKGTQFKAKRRGSAKVVGAATFGVGALLVPKTRVKCVTCGTEYLRG